MTYILNANIWLSVLTWGAFAVAALSHLHNANRLQQHIDNHHPEWWYKLFRTDWQRRLYPYSPGRLWMLGNLIYFFDSVPDRVPDPEFDRILNNARGSALIATVLLTLAIISAAWLPFNPPSH